MKKFLKKKYIYPAVVILFALMIIANNYIWVGLDQSIYDEDPYRQLSNSYKFLEVVRTNIASKHYEMIIPRLFFVYPPLVYLLTNLIYLVFGMGKFIAIMSLSPFIILLLLSIYFIGCHLMNEDAGILMALTAISFPFAMWSTQQYMLDIPCAGGVAFSLLCLLKSEYFSRRFWTIMFFLAFSFAMQVKWLALAYILFPLIYCGIVFIIRMIKEKNSLLLFFVSIFTVLILTGVMLRISENSFTGDVEINLALLKSMGVFLLLLAVVSFLRFPDPAMRWILQGILLLLITCWHFYGLRFFPMINNFGGHSHNNPILTYDFIRFFIFHFYGITRTALLLPGLIAGLFLLKKNRDLPLIYVGTFSSLFILTRTVYEPRYFLPLIPYAVFFMVFWAVKIPWKPLRYPVVTALLLMNFIGAFGWSFPGIYDSNIKEYQYQGNNFRGLFMRSEYVAFPPRMTGWPFWKMVQQMDRLFPEKHGLIFIGFSNKFRYCAQEPTNILPFQYFEMKKRYMYVPKLLSDTYPIRFTEDKLGTVFLFSDEKNQFITPIQTNDFFYKRNYSHIMAMIFTESPLNKTAGAFLNELRARGLQFKPMFKETIDFPEENYLHIYDLILAPPLPGNAIDRNSEYNYTRP